MIRTGIFFALLATSVFAAKADKTNYIHEANLDLSTVRFLTTSGSTSFTVAAGYNYLVHQLIQVGAIGNLTATSGTTAFSIQVGPVINYPFEGDLAEAFFLKPMIGFSGTSGTTSFIFSAYLGKRFRIFEHLSYTPEVFYSNTAGSSAFGANVLAFSLFY